MKKTIQILSLLLLPNFVLIAQIKIEKLENKTTTEAPPQYKSWFRGFDMALQTCQTQTKGSPNVTSVKEQYKNVGIHVGYQSNKHKWEIGLSLGRDDNSWTYKNTNLDVQIGHGTDRPISTMRLGYTYQIYKINKRWTIDVGGGVNWVNLINRDSLNGLGNTDGEKIIWYADETILRKNSFCIDGKIQLNYTLTPHWQAHLLYQYRYAPQYLRSSYAVYYDFKTVQKLDAAYTKSSPSAVLIGLGLQYHIQPLFDRPIKEIKPEISLKSFHIGLDYGLINNTGSMKSTVNLGSISGFDPIVLITPRAGINIGYRYGRHDFEMGFQTLLNFVNFQFDTIGNFTQAREQGFGTKAIYLPLRYHYSLLPQRKKWKIDAGVGIGFARFIEQDSTEFTDKTTIQETITLSNNTVVSYDYSDKERMNHRQTACFEGNFRLRRQFYNEHWQFNLWGRYIWNPWSMRTVKFDIKYNNQPERFGQVSTSLTSFGVGAGLSYAF
jgi:hypothetical protein